MVSVTSGGAGRFERSDGVADSFIRLYEWYEKLFLSRRNRGDTFRPGRGALAQFSDGILRRSFLAQESCAILRPASLAGPGAGGQGFWSIPTTEATRVVRAEVCVGGREDALAAEAGGADRIELCAGLVVGGLTPSLGTVATVLADVGIPTVVLVRPREGDFCYTSAEMEVLLRDVRFLREAGVHGIATGVLRRNGTVDRDAMERIQDAAGSMAITFHRAFDMTRDPWESLAVLMELGIPRLLTSGLESGVVEGTPLIRGLVESAGGALSVMPGGGVRPENVETLIRETGVSEVHFTAFSTSESPMTHRNLRPRMGGGRVPGEFERTVTDPERVKLFLEKIRGGG